MVKRKKKKKLVILVIILIAIVVAMSIIFLEKRKKTKEKPYSEVLPIAAGDFSGELAMRGTGVFFDKYTGDLTASDVSDKLEKIITTYLPKIHKLIKDYDTADLQKFYNNNSKNLTNMIGITNEDDFVEFAKNLQQAKVDFNTWDSVEVLKDTFVDESDKEGYSYSEYVVSYKNGLELTFTLYTAKSYTTEPQYITKIK